MTRSAADLCFDSEVGTEGPCQDAPGFKCAAYPRDITIFIARSRHEVLSGAAEKTPTSGGR